MVLMNGEKMKIKTKRKIFEDKRKEILEMAAKGGLQFNFFFSNTFDVYCAQMRTAQRLAAELMEIKKLVIEQEGVKSYIDPNVSEFNKTADSLNKTLGSLLRLINTFDAQKKVKETDPLLKALNGDS